MNLTFNYIFYFSTPALDFCHLKSFCPERTHHKVETGECISLEITKLVVNLFGKLFVGTAHLVGIHFVPKLKRSKTFV